MLEVTAPRSIFIVFASIPAVELEVRPDAGVTDRVDFVQVKQFGCFAVNVEETNILAFD